MEEPHILFEDEEILVLDKPSGITVNRSDTTTGEKTIQDWAEGYMQIASIPRAQISQNEDPFNNAEAFF